MNLREKQKQMTGQIIREAALELFCSQGIERTEMAQIAEKAGVSRRTLYLHYNDKEELAARLYVENLERMFGQLLFDFDFSQPVQSLERILEQYLALREQEEALIYYDAIFGVYYSTLAKNPAELPDFKQAMEVWYSRFLSLEMLSVPLDDQKKWLDTLHKSTHLYFMYLQKAVILTRQRGGVVTEEDRAADRQFKEFILAGVRAT
ncbi:helix-turn-helix domain-containing protein [Paenibacillus sp. FSL K6-1096]|uniref:TetR/AcrR family transcriptional regulator n=1 Tax=Paenibacillus sp. FSL K6-1096 TaxID=2921460 RepID=UPI0030EBDFDA